MTPPPASYDDDYHTTLRAMITTAEHRIIACFKGLATGDAIGKRTETLSRDKVLRWYPEGIRGFEGTPGDVIPRYVGNVKRLWRVGETTDDTEGAIAVARAILRDRKVRHVGVGVGDPGRIAQGHDGCGAAVLAAPVGILCSSQKLEQLVEGAYQSSIPTPGGQLAISAAAAVAAPVSAAMDGLGASEVASLAVRAAQRAEQRRPAPGDGTIAPVCSVQDVILAANVGGDADSVASIGGAIAGPLYPDTVNEDGYNSCQGRRSNVRRRGTGETDAQKLASSCLMYTAGRKVWD